MSVPFRVDLSGKIAVVTGGGGVLCSCFAEALGECGAKVAVLDLSLDAADAVAKRICANGGTAQAFACNVLEKESILAAGNAVIAAFGNIDILINGAGGNNPRATTDREYLFPEDLTGEADGKSFFDLTPEGIQFVFNLNCLGTLLPTQVFARNMAVHGGIIINISSMNAYRPLTKIPAYSAAKAAVSNLTMWLAVHLSKVNIRVNAIAPGFFVTKQNEKLLFDDNGNPTPRTDKILAHTPMGRFGKPEELVGTLLYLCDNNASGFVNGTVIPVDGGFAAYSGV
ncbi:oxidoreductase short chain dehydrogenase/reductase family protein [Ruminococcus sp. CAG:382]|nr:oxidoreductase short chain dehydrogenase/reductase family protein [Ruminococcus sp. CAG:382]